MLIYHVFIIFSGSPEFKKDTKILMQFGAFMRDEAKDRGLDALALESPFDQLAILEVIEFFLEY